MNNRHVTLAFVCTLCILGSEVLCQPEVQTTDLRELSSQQQDELYQILLKRTEDMAKPYQRPLDAFDYCGSGDIDALRDYLDNGGDPNWVKQPAGMPYPLLLSAILTFNVECAELLIKRGANVNVPAFNVRNIATAVALKRIDIKNAQYNGKGNIQHYHQLNQGLNMLLAHGAMIDNQFLTQKANEAGKSLWKQANDINDIIIVVKCMPDYIHYTDIEIAEINMQDTERISAWLDKQIGKIDHVIAVDVYSGGEQTEKLLYDLCMERNIRLFTRRIGLE